MINKILLWTLTPFLMLIFVVYDHSPNWMKDLPTSFLVIILPGIILEFVYVYWIVVFIFSLFGK